MPVLRECYYCKKKFLTSSYGLWSHIENNCKSYQEYIKNQAKGKIIKESSKKLKINIKNLDNETKIQPKSLSCRS
tara:strand:- start:17 stop:241 length:225 start_codon:yes stop_codon:yes gene_type:complete